MKIRMGNRPHIRSASSEQLLTKSRSVYDEFHKKDMSCSRPSKFHHDAGHSPTVARGTWELVRNVLVAEKSLAGSKEMIFVAISQDRNCGYCRAAHIACCRMLGVKPELLDELVRDYKSITDLKVRDTILFAVKCSKNPQSLTEADYDKLREFGYKQSEIVELIAMSAFAVYANIIADATSTEPDKMFDEIYSTQETLSTAD
jgi:uncharacterized peroxidase-related enzyme